MPKSRHPNCLLSRHEAAFFSKCKVKAAEVGSHRGEKFNSLILPLCQPLIQAIGHRMAYEAALDAGLDQHQLDLFEVHSMKANAACYSDFASIGWWEQHEMEEKAATEALRFFDRDVKRLEAAPFAVAPMLSDERWRIFTNELHCFSSGDMELNLFDNTENMGESKVRYLGRL